MHICDPMSWEDAGEDGLTELLQPALIEGSWDLASTANWADNLTYNALTGLTQVTPTISGVTSQVISNYQVK